jgi:putative phosphoesterase
VIHAGDWVVPETLLVIGQAAEQAEMSLYGVYGNNDLPDELQRANRRLKRPAKLDGVLELDLGGVRFGVAHGHRPTALRVLANHVDVIVRGHSHKVLNDATGGVLWLNPGSTSHTLPRRADDQRSVMVFDTATSQAVAFWLRDYKS